MALVGEPGLNMAAILRALHHQQVAPPPAAVAVEPAVAPLTPEQILADAISGDPGFTNQRSADVDAITRAIVNFGDASGLNSAGQQNYATGVPTALGLALDPSTGIAGQAAGNPYSELHTIMHQTAQAIENAQNASNARGVLQSGYTAQNTNAANASGQEAQARARSALEQAIANINQQDANAFQGAYGRVAANPPGVTQPPDPNPPTQYIPGTTTPAPKPGYGTTMASALAGPGAQGSGIAPPIRRPAAPAVAPKIALPKPPRISIPGL